MMMKRFRNFCTRRALLRAGVLMLCALALAVGLEWVMQRTLPPIFVDAEVDLSKDPTLIDRGTTYLHSSGRPALVEEWYLPRLLATFALQLLILILVFPLGLGRKLVSWLRAAWASLRRELRQEKRRNLRLCGLFLVTFAGVFLLCRVWIRDVYARDNWMTLAVCCWSALGAACLVTFRRTLAAKPEVLFLVLTLIAGGMISYFLPDGTRVAMDDGYHFQHALNYSTFGRVRFTATDWERMQEDNEHNYSLSDWDDFLSAQDELHAQGAVFVTSRFHLNIKEHWMMTQGLGLFLGRLLHLRYWDTWALGRFTGLLAYALIGFFAIRRLKSGRMILAMALMMPSNLFLAANYSYDPGVTAGIYLACAYWLAQWQEREQPLRSRDVAVMVVPMLLACYVKAIYFPIFLLFLFLPRAKFRDLRHRRAYTAVILLAMVAVMLHILLPLGRSGGQGDTRAEGDVNTFGQIQFILQNPLEYLGYLWHYLQVLLDPNEMDFLTSSFGYQGCGHNMIPVLMILAVVTFTDASEAGLLPGTGVRMAGQALLFGSLALMVTSMYVWFSAVGSASFDGMQPRYVLPFLYPVLALAGSNRTKNGMNPALHHGFFLAAMSFMTISSLLQTCIEYYH